MAGGAGDGGARKQDRSLNSRGNAGGARGEEATDGGGSGEGGELQSQNPRRKETAEGQGWQENPEERGSGRAAGGEGRVPGAGLRRSGSRVWGRGTPGRGPAPRSCSVQPVARNGARGAVISGDLGARGGPRGAREAAANAPESPGRGWVAWGAALSPAGRTGRCRPGCGRGALGRPWPPRGGKRGPPSPVRPLTLRLGYSTAAVAAAAPSGGPGVDSTAPPLRERRRETEAGARPPTD